LAGVAARVYNGRMRIKAFDLQEPLPDLESPHAVAMLEPWIDAGNVGSMTLSWLEDETGARPLGELAKPGAFYDFTRYRPMTYFIGEERRLRLPNTRVTFAKRLDGPDFLFFRLLEPTALGEYFVDSVVKLLERFDVSRFALIGSMYNLVPHTRPLMVSGGGSPETLRHRLEALGVRGGRYEGPTSICSSISQRMAARGCETMSMIVSLPQYTQLDDDYIGTLRLQGILASLYGFVLPEEAVHQADLQREQVNEAVASDPQVKEIVDQLETSFDRGDAEDDEAEPSGLSPQVEDFLREMERRFRRDEAA
jgi:hypothetical protein